MGRLVVSLVLIVAGFYAAFVPDVFRRKHSALTNLSQTKLRRLMPTGWLAWVDSHIAYGVSGKIRSRQVIAGKDGWLFYMSPTDGASYDDYIGEKRFDDDFMRRVAVKYSEFGKKLKKRGVAFCLMLVPNKENVYPELMPAKIRRRSPVSQTDVLLRFLETHAGISVVDPKKRLVEAKSWTDVYYPLDTHWNLIGGSVGVQCVCDALGLQHSSVECGRSLSSRLLSFPDDDLARIAQVKDIYRSSGRELVPDDCPPIDLSDVEKSSRERVATLVNKHALTRKSILLSGDSFRISMLPALLKVFEKVYVGYRLTESEAVACVEANRPDVFLMECVERYSHRLLSF